MEYTTILSTEVLAAHLNDPDWVIIDCRFELSQPEWGSATYRQAHIPGAVFADLNHDLSSPITPVSGRHPLPEPARWRETVTRWGIHPDAQVVTYDATGGTIAAARLWWLLRASGHPRVAVLDGGFPKWQRENRLFTADIPARRPYPFEGVLDPASMVTSEQLMGLHRDPRLRLIDARAPERFRGEIEPIDRVAGHIPGAKNHPVAQSLNEDQTFKLPEQLRADFLTILGEVPPQNVISYCGSGVTACHNLLALEIAGLAGARLYPGSWSEWSRDPGRPIETGAG